MIARYVRIILAVLLAGLLCIDTASSMEWFPVNSGITGQHFDGIEWNGSQYVVVGTGGAIVTSPDGYNWSQRSSGVTSHLYDVLWNGSKYIAVGAGGILSSPDGTVWQKVHDVSGPILKDIAWNGSCFVVVGDNGYIATSSNGTQGSWTTVASGISERLEGVAWGCGKFVAVGTNGTVLTSVTGSVWTPGTSGTTEWLLDVEWINNNYFWAVAANATSMKSFDGVSWSVNPGSGEDLYDVASSDRRLLEVGEKGTVILHDYLGGGWLSSGTTELLTDINWNGRQFLAAGTNGTILLGSSVLRISGSNRYSTAVNISKKGWPGGASTVVLARGDNYADALAGVPLAYAEDAPILLTSSASLNPDTKNEIARLGASKVIILGGTGAVSAQVEQGLKSMGLTVSRISGNNRYETAANICQFNYTLSTSNTAVIVYGHNYPDALAAASYAATNGYPILLVDKNTVPQETMDCMGTGLFINNTIVVGGTGVISNQALGQLPNPVRVSGVDRYATSVELINFFNPVSMLRYVATGLGFADAITGAVLAAKDGTGILLVGNSVSPEVQQYLANPDITDVTVLGGPGVVSANIFRRIQEIMQ